MKTVFEVAKQRQQKRRQQAKENARFISGQVCNLSE